MPELQQYFSEFDGPSIFLPMDLTPFERVDFMRLALEHRVKTGNGYSGFALPAESDFNDYDSELEAEDIMQRFLPTYKYIAFDLVK